MKSGRKIVAGLLCLLMCLSLVHLAPPRAAAESAGEGAAEAQSTEPAVQGEEPAAQTVPEAPAPADNPAPAEPPAAEEEDPAEKTEEAAPPVEQPKAEPDAAEEPEESASGGGVPTEAETPTVTEAPAEEPTEPAEAEPDAAEAADDAETADDAAEEDEAEAEAKSVTFRLNWNGWQGKYAELICTREKTAKFGDNGIVAGMNYKGPWADLDGKTGEVLDQFMEDYWKKTDFDGYYFDGWYTASTGGTKMTYSSQISDTTYYAHWHREDKATSGNTDAAITKLTIKADQETIDPAKTGGGWTNPKWLTDKDGHSTVSVESVEPSGAAISSVTWYVSVDGSTFKEPKEFPGTEFSTKSSDMSIIVGGGTNCKSNGECANTSVQVYAKAANGTQSNTVTIKFEHSFSAPQTKVQDGQSVSFVSCMACGLEQILEEPASPSPEVTEAQRTVILDAGDGWFGNYGSLPDDSGMPDGFTNKTRTAKLDGNGNLTNQLADPTTALEAAGQSKNEKLKSSLTGTWSNPNNKENGNSTFKGWWTEEPTTTTEKRANGEYVYTFTNHGQKIEESGQVSEGVTRLYASYTDGNADEPKTATVSWYDLNFNGFSGMNTVLTCVRSDLSKFGSSGIIAGVNYSGNWSDLDSKEPKALQEFMEKYWKENTFDGYTFEGWYTERHNGTKVNFDSTVTPGKTYYAHWTKEGGSSSQDYEPPAPPKIDNIYFQGVDLAGHDVHAGDSQTVRVISSPSGTTATDITWTVEVTRFASKEHLTDTLGGKNQTKETIVLEPKKESAKGNQTSVEITADGETLTIKGGTKESADMVTVSVTASVTVGGSTLTTSAPAVVTFSHEWTRQEEGFKEPTCTEKGKTVYKCSHDGCSVTKTVETMPTGHSFAIQSCQESGGIVTWSKKCVTCSRTESGATLTPMEMRSATNSATAKTVAEVEKMCGAGVTVKVTDPSGKPITGTSRVGTGSKITVTGSDGKSVTIDVVVAGDVDGDGLINGADASAMNSALCGSALTGQAKQAACVNGSDSYNVCDVVAVLDLAG